MKTASKTQNQRLLAYLRKHRKGITTMEAFANLGICRLSERIRELESLTVDDYGRINHIPITRTRETTPTGATVTRYKLAR
jgi:hypothetical protein